MPAIEWPETASIGWLEVNIRPFREGEGDERQRHGEAAITATVQEIRYEKRATPQRQAHTILHELIHVALVVMGPSGLWDVVMDNLRPKDRDEVVVAALADSLACIAADNPELWRLIQENLMRTG